MFKLGRATREHIANELTALFKENNAAIVTNLQAVGVNKVQSLRKPLKGSSAKFRIVKNSMARIAAKKARKEFLAPLFEGTCAVGFCDQKDFLDVSKILVNFSRENEGFKICGGYFTDEFITVDKIRELAMLPSKAVLLARAVGGIKAPISGFVGVLNNLVSGLVRVVNEITKKGGTKNE